MRSTASALLLLALALPTLAGAAEGRSDLFVFNELRADGLMRDHILSDMNGDGLADLGMIVSTVIDGKKIFAFQTCLQSPTKGFSQACARLSLPEDARAFDVGDIGDVGEMGEMGERRAAELLVLTSGGLRMASFAERSFGALAPVVPLKTILDNTDPLEPTHLDFIRDLDAVGRESLILPTFEGPALYEYRDAGFALRKQLHSPARVSYRVGTGRGPNINETIHSFTSQTQAIYTAPDTFVEDFDGDGQLDLITLLDTELKVFLREPSGAFPVSPSLELERSVLSPDEKGGHMAGEALTFSDLNGDGLSDLVVVSWGGKEQRTRIDRHIYYARPLSGRSSDGASKARLEYPAKADQIVRSESTFPDFSIMDLNGDGRRDLVIPFFHFATSQVFKVATQSEVKIQFRLFLMGDNGRFSQDPKNALAKVDRRISLDYRINLLGMIFNGEQLASGEFNPLINFGGDLNGDGFPDLVADSGRNRLGIYWGNEKASYPRSPDLVVPFESAGDFDLVDLNGDGKTDIVTYYSRDDKSGKTNEATKPAKSSARRPALPASPARYGAAKPPRAKVSNANVKILLSR